MYIWKIFIKNSRSCRQKVWFLHNVVYFFLENLNSSIYLFIDYGLRQNSNILFSCLKYNLLSKYMNYIIQCCCLKATELKKSRWNRVIRKGMFIINLTVSHSGYRGNRRQPQRVVGVDPINTHNLYTRYLYENCDVHILRFRILSFNKKKTPNKRSSISQQISVELNK